MHYELCSLTLLPQGCYNKLLTLLRENINLLVGALAGMAAMQIMVITGAFCVCRVSWLSVTNCICSARGLCLLI